MSKLCEDMTENERIEKFWSEHNRTDKYTGHDFWRWHNLLTGSCEMGRNQFVSDNELDLDKEYTVAEFVETCKNAYGSRIIRRLLEE
jgi:hypothetical protein